MYKAQLAIGRTNITLSGLFFTILIFTNPAWGQTELQLEGNLVMLN